VMKGAELARLEPTLQSAWDLAAENSLVLKSVLVGAIVLPLYMMVRWLGAWWRGADTGDIGKEVLQRAEKQMASLDEELSSAVLTLEQRLALSPSRRSSKRRSSGALLYRTLLEGSAQSNGRAAAEPLAEASGDMHLPPDFVPCEAPRVKRFCSQDIKQAVNHVLMPKYLAHQSRISKLKIEHRTGQLSRVHHRRAVNASAREFDTQYASAIRAATTLVEKLPPEVDVIPLAELKLHVSADEAELVMVEELQAQMHELSERRSSEEASTPGRLPR